LEGVYGFADATPEGEKALLSLKSAALLKLSYVQLMLGNPHSALIASQELRQLPSSAMTEHHK
jgi:predicted small integral membrane protein